MGPLSGRLGKGRQGLLQLSDSAPEHAKSTAYGRSLHIMDLCSSISQLALQMHAGSFCEFTLNNGCMANNGQLMQNHTRSHVDACSETAELFTSGVVASPISLVASACSNVRT